MDEYTLNPESIISDLLASSLMHAHETGRRHLYIWEARGLARLAREPSMGNRNAWTGDRVRAYAENKPILPGWSINPYTIDMFDEAPTAPR